MWLEETAEGLNDKVSPFLYRYSSFSCITIALVVRHSQNNTEHLSSLPQIEYSCTISRLKRKASPGFNRIELQQDPPDTKRRKLSGNVRCRHIQAQ